MAPLATAQSSRTIVEPSTIEEVHQQPTFDSYYPQMAASAYRFDPFPPQRAFPGQTFASSFLPNKRREELVDIEEQIRLYKSQASETHSERRVASKTPATDLVETNQAKLQMIDRKAVQQAPVSLPSLPQVEVEKYAGQEAPLVERYMDVSFVEKDLPESKQARHHLGLGMPEARALQKRCGVSSFRDLCRWYLSLAY